MAEATPVVAGPSNTPAIVVDKVHHQFIDRAGVPMDALRDMTVTVPEGQFLAIVGPSGCGKTTVLNMVAGILSPTAGAVRVNGVQVTGPSRDIGYMTARDGLLPWRTARENVMFGLEVRGMGKGKRVRRANEVLNLVGLRHFVNAYPSELSQGMRQRVSLARTLAFEPKLFLLDEPFAALDAQTKIILQEEFIRIWENSKRTVVFVTHDLQEAVGLADRVLVFSAAPASICLDLPIELPRPRQVEELRFEPDYIALTEQVWRAIRPQMSQTEPDFVTDRTPVQE